jgi:hypothetical protein
LVALPPAAEIGKMEYRGHQRGASRLAFISSHQFIYVSWRAAFACAA